MTCKPCGPKKRVHPPPPLLLKTAKGCEVDLEGLYQGKSVFLLCGGPSVKTLDLEQLRRPGVTVAAINNAWVLWKPQLWVCVDSPGHFLDTLWKDPSILKFVPEKVKNSWLHVRKKDGSFRQSVFKAGQMPGVFFYPRNADFNHATYLVEPSVNWGNSGGVKDSLGIKGSRSVMLAAIKLLYYLGFRNVFLLGADFHMSTTLNGNYAFRQQRTKSSVKGNNRTYEVLGQRFEALRPTFKKAGFSIYNCNPDSALKVFPMVPYQRAVDNMSEACSKVVSTEGWYSHGKIKARK